MYRLEITILIEDETDTILRYSFVVFRNNVGRTA